jgi:putative ABC transport system permease protein
MRFSTVILRNLLQRKLRSFLAIIGITVAMGSAVALLALSQEFEGSLQELYEARGVEMVVVRAGVADRLSSNLAQGLGERIRQLAGVRDVAAVLVDVVALPDVKLLSVPLQGWDTDSFLFNDLKIKNGRRFHKGEGRTVLLGEVLARNLQKGPGDRLEIEGVAFQIVGTYESFNIFENSSVLMALEELQAFTDRPRQVTAFQLLLEPVPNKQELVQRLRQQIEALPDDRGRPARVAALPVREHVNTVMQIQLARAVAWMTSAIAFLVGTLGISNTMIMAVAERTQEIGILRALGWRRSRIMRMIVYEALLLSLAGSVLGLAWGALLLAALSASPQVSGMIKGSLSPEVAVEGVLLGCATGLLGGLYPALRATLLLPIKALRQET